MKTLDEVIFEAPYSPTPWEENAIYYLKEYRDHMKNEIIELQEEVKKQKEMIEFLKKPLTWDELRQMEGKPVWIEEIEDDKILFSRWDIISGFGYSENFDLIDYENPIIDFYRSGNRTKFGLCKSWLAYRKERA